VLGKRFVVVPVNDYQMKVDLKTPGLSRVLFVYGCRELLDTHLVAKEIKADMNILEAGANIGYYTLLEAKRTSGTIFAMEPDPRNIPLLEDNVKLNNFSDRVKVWPLAASDESGTKDFFLGKRTNVSSFVDKKDDATSTPVECIKLDDFPHRQEVDFIRMDVEGYECKVLDGMKAMIETNRPLQIFLELHYSAYNDSDLNFRTRFEWLLDSGFRVKYLIVSSRKRSLFADKGYQPIKTATETSFTRDLYEEISSEDALEFFDKSALRSVWFARD
jgi:FkbM family methyltransferase